MSVPRGLRVLSWNVLEGFHLHEQSVLDMPRLEAARRVIARLKPDVVVLNEALWCEPGQGELVDYAGLLGFEHSACALYDGHWGNAVLSNQAILSQQRFAIYNRGGLVVEVLDNAGKPVRIATYHPHPSRRPHKKAEDYAAMAALLEGKPGLICGDFNALNPTDNVCRQALVDGFARFSSRPEFDVDRFILGGQAVFEALELAGLHDALPSQGRRHTMPTPLISGGDTSTAMRIDHIMVNAGLRVLDAGVIHEPDTGMASDHYPVFADVVVAD